MVKIPTPALQGANAIGAEAAAAAVTPYSNVQGANLGQPARDIGMLASAVGRAADAAAAVAGRRKKETDLVRRESDKLRLQNDLSTRRREMLKEFDQTKGIAARGMTDRAQETTSQQIEQILANFTPADEAEQLALRAVTQSWQNELVDYASRYELQQEEAARSAEEQAYISNMVESSAIYAFEEERLEPHLNGLAAFASSVATSNGLDRAAAAEAVEAAYTAGVKSALDRRIAFDDYVGAGKLLDSYDENMEPDTVTEYRAALLGKAREEAAVGVARQAYRGLAHALNPDQTASDNLVAAMVNTEAQEAFKVPPGSTVELTIEAMTEAEAKAAATLTSGVGATGITQLMSATMADPGMGVAPYKYADGIPEGTSWHNVLREQHRFGRDYLNALISRYDGDVNRALTAYHSGAGNVDRGKLGPRGKEYAGLVGAQLRDLSGGEPPSNADILRMAGGDEGIAQDAITALTRLKAYDQAVADDKRQADLAKAVDFVMKTPAVDLKQMATSDKSRAQLAEDYGVMAPKILQMIDNQQKRLTDDDLRDAEMRWARTPPSKQTLDMAWELAQNTAQFLRFQSAVEATKGHRAEIASAAQELDIGAVKTQVASMLQGGMPKDERPDAALVAAQQNDVIDRLYREQVERGVAYTPVELYDRVKFHMAEGVSFLNTRDVEWNVLSADNESYSVSKMLMAAQGTTADEVYTTYFKDVDPSDLLLELTGGRRVYVDPAIVFTLSSELSKSPSTNTGRLLIQSIIDYYREDN